MSHEIRFASYPENCNPKEVAAEWDEIVRHEDYQEGASGLCHPIRWIDKVLPTREEAVQYINSIDSGWYDNIAVKYRDFSHIKQPKEIEKFDERIQKAQIRYNNLDRKDHFENAKAAFISCPRCKSKIASEYLRWNRCPVCGADMRPKTVLDRLSSLEASIKKLQKEKAEAVKAFQAKKEKNAKIKWLVKVEFHT